MKLFFRRHFNNKSIIALSIISTIFLSSTIFSVVISTKVDKAIYIESAHDFNSISNNLNGHYIVNTQVFLNDEPIRPIGTKEKPFTGIIEATSKKRVLSSLCNISFDKEYLAAQFNSTENDEVNIGLFAYNSGTIKGICFYNITIPDLSEYVSSDKTINFGAIAANNDGWINKCEVQNLNGSLKGKNINYGTIASKNSGEIKICKCTSISTLDVYGGATVGGLVSTNLISTNYRVTKSEPYIWSSISSQIKINIHAGKDKFSIIFGGVCGLLIDGLIEDCVGTNVSRSLTGEGESPFLIVGGIVGSVKSASCCVKKCFVSFECSSSLNGYFSSAIGSIGDYSVIQIESIIVKPIKVSITNSEALFGIVSGYYGKDTSIDAVNNYYYSQNVICDHANYLYSNATFFENVNIYGIGYADDLWIKNEDKEILKNITSIWKE